LNVAMIYSFAASPSLFFFSRSGFPHCREILPLSPRYLIFFFLVAPPPVSSVSTVLPSSFSFSGLLPFFIVCGTFVSSVFGFECTLYPFLLCLFPFFFAFFLHQFPFLKHTLLLWPFTVHCSPESCPAFFGVVPFPLLLTSRILLFLSLNFHCLVC